MYACISCVCDFYREFRENSYRNMNVLKPFMEIKLLSVYLQTVWKIHRRVRTSPQNMGYSVQVLEKLLRQVLGVKL